MERGIKETMQNKKIIQVEDKVPPRLLVPLSIQHMFAMFGASVLVPFMLGISPAIVLFMNGIGEQTAQAARKYGMQVRVAQNATIDAMIDQLKMEN